MKKIVKLTLSIVLAAVSVLSFAACGPGGTRGAKRVDFVYGGTTEYLTVMKQIIDSYNDGQGKVDGINVRSQPTSSTGLSTQAQAALTDVNGADIIMLRDDYFKLDARSGLVDLTGMFPDELLADMYPTHLNRYYYDRATNTSYSDDPLLGLPLNNDSTVLYYNKTALQDLGIKCISVSEEEMDAFNDGAADHNGKTKSDYGIPSDFTVPKKGFYREYPYVYSKDEEQVFTPYEEDELMIYNDRITMSWDEMDDISRLCTKTYNSKSDTKYGYYTEWWFNYGWSVGGDCLQDMSGDGDFAYSLADGNPNYIVLKDSYTGKHTGTVYNVGETLDFKDVISADPADKISYETDNVSLGNNTYATGSYFYWTVNGTKSAPIADVTAAKASGVLGELPSISEALMRYCSISGVGVEGESTRVMPQATTVSNGGGTIRYFTNQYVAFCIEYSSNFKQVDRDAKFEWGISTLPVYKQYAHPEDADNDELVVEGKPSNHSLGYCVCINGRSTLKEEAKTFMEWLVTEGQTILAKNSFMTSLASQKQFLADSFEFDNEWAYMKSLEYSLPGDWWYMPDATWINNNWAKTLNTNVRNGTMDPTYWLYNYIGASNTALEAYFD